MSALIEVIDPAELPVRVAALRNPFSFGREDLARPAGPTVAELLEEIGVRGAVRVWVGDVEIWPERFAWVRPKPGSVVTVRAVARGGGRGGGIGKMIGGAVIAIIGVLLILIGSIASPFTAGATISLVPAGWWMIGMGASLMLSGLINVLIPVPKPKLPILAGVLGAQSQPESPALSISGQANSLRPYSAVPRVLGRHRVFPPYAARSFTEMVGADQYLRLLFCLTYGPCAISELKIGDTPLENFQDVETEFISGAPGQPSSTLYAVDVFEAPLSVVLLQNVGQVRTSQSDAVELSVDWIFPEGLVQFDAQGSKQNTAVSMTVEYRAVGAGSFTAAPGSPVVTTEARQGLVRAGLRWAAPAAGAYDVRLTRTTADSADPLLRNATVWSALRTIGRTPPVLLDNVSLLAMRVKATDQLNGVVDNFNLIVEALVKDYATYAGSVLADAPLGYWRLGEVLGAPTAFDASGHGRSGLYQGAPTLGAAGLLTGDASTAMGCDGGDDTVTTFAGLAAIDMGSSSFTVEAIVRAANLTGNRGIVHKGDGLEFASGHTGWALIRASNVLRFTRAVGSGAPTLVDSGVILADTTYHVVVVYDRGANTARMTVNGAPQGPVTMPSATYVDAYGLEISHASDNPWEGRLQEVAVYPTALSAARIAAHYAASQGTREWVTQRSSNPASYFRDYLQYAGNARPVADGRVDLIQIQAWHAENAIAGRSVNAVIDYDTALYEVLRDVVAPCGRATVTLNDDKYAPLRDLPQTVPAQLFTPRNSRNWSGQRVLPEVVHAVKVRFTNPDANWQQDERIVYDDGYSAAGEVFGTVPATRFTVLELHGVTDPDLAWRMARYHLAVTRLRPEIYNLETDVEALACRRGDLVYVQHDVVEFGLGSGRIKTVTVVGGQATAVTVDEALPMVGGTTYGVRVRLADGTQRQAQLVTVAGDQTTLTFAAPLAAPLPAVGDLLSFGVVGQETVPAVVARITPAPDFMAQLALVDYAPGVQQADQGTIPAYQSNITLQAPPEQLPPTPVIDGVVSDETVLLRDLDGSLRSRVVIALHYVSTSNVQADFVEARYRLAGSAAPFETLPRLPADTDTVILNTVEDGAAYDIRVRSVNREGPTSPWAEVLNYTVIGKTTPPPVPTNLRLEQVGLVWDYGVSPLDMAGFILRMSPGAVGSWGNAVPLHVGIVTASPFPLGTLYGPWTFMVAAVDTSGNESDPAMLTVDFGDVRLHNQVATYDYKANTFPGTITNGSVSAGDLKADQLSTGFWAADGNLFWAASGATLFWTGTYKQMTYLFSYTTAASDVGATLFFDTTVVAEHWTLEYRVGGSGDYLPWTGALVVLGSQQYDFRLVTVASPIQGVVSRLTLWLDALDLSESQVSVNIAITTGTRLTLQNTYRAIKTVQVTVVSGAGAQVSAIAVDKQNTAGANNGPLIKVFDAAGAVIAGVVDATIVGY